MHMAYHKVVIAGINTADLTVMGEEEKMRLLREYKETGSKAVRDRLIRGNLRLVLSVVQRFAGRGEDVDDLFQIGVIGLMKAIGNFDLTKEVRFSTYCVPMIAGELRRHLRDYTHIKSICNRCILIFPDHIDDGVRVWICEEITKIIFTVKNFPIEYKHPPFRKKLNIC